MRVLVISQYFWPENFRINDLVNGLKERGHTVTVLTGKPNYPEGKIFPEFKVDQEKFTSFNGVEVVRVPMLPRGKGALRLFLNYLTFALSASIIGAYSLRRKQFDLIFVFEPSPVTVGIPAAVIRKYKKIPVAFWVLDLWPETLAAVGIVKSKVVLKLVGSLVSWIYERCDLILAQSRSFKENIKQYCDCAEKIVYFPSWSDTSGDLGSISYAEEVDRRPEIFTIVFTGNIGSAQDFPTIVRAAKMLEERVPVRWVIVGDGRFFEDLKRLAFENSLNDNFLLLGRYPVERMPSFFRHADALLVSLKDDPIFSMTIPGKLQSYLATGIPIIAALDGEGADLINSCSAGLATPSGNAGALAESVFELASMSKEQRDEMGRNAKALYEREFEREMLISKLEALFEKTLLSFRSPGENG